MDRKSDYIEGSTDIDYSCETLSTPHAPSSCRRTILHRVVPPQTNTSTPVNRRHNTRLLIRQPVRTTTPLRASSTILTITGTIHPWLQEAVAGITRRRTRPTTRKDLLQRMALTTRLTRIIITRRNHRRTLASRVTHRVNPRAASGSRRQD